MKPYHVTFESIGTTWSIDIEGVSDEEGNKVLEIINKRIEEFDKNYSRFRSDSLVTQMAKQPGDYTFPLDALPLLRLYKELYDITDGIFTPLIGNMMEEAGYDSTYTLKPKQISSLPTWDQTLSYIKPILTIKNPALLDFGACGKGYLVDIICDVLKSQGVNDFCVDAGGDMFYNTTKDEFLSVGLEHPENPKQVLGIAKIQNQSICGSSGNRRKWDKYHHIINPETMSSPKEILSTWVIAESAMLADALATCLFFVSPQKLLSHFDFTYVMVDNKYLVDASPEFKGELFTEHND